MSSTEKFSCDLCHVQLFESVYIPKNTRRAMKVYVCDDCGLVQSRQGVPEPERIQTLSTDADWGNVRHGKGVRFDALKAILKNEIRWENIKKVADIGSNRGDFILWLQKNHPGVDCCAIEPDKNVVEKYADLSGVILHLDRVEHVTLPDDNFDLIFCSHTLEHADSAVRMIEIMHGALRPSGYLLLEVPNLEGIAGQNVIEEFFIDKHTFHFDRETLIDYIDSSGFTILKGRNHVDPLNLTLLLQKDGNAVSYHPMGGVERSKRNRNWVNEFSEKLPLNRELLKWIVEEKLRPLSDKQRVGYWGAGRILDTLVKYGGLRSDDVYCLVDRHLHNILEKTHGIQIERPEMLRIREPQVVVALGRSAENYMTKTAYSYGVRHIVKFSELMEQARDAISCE